MIKHWKYREFNAEKVAPNSIVLFYIGWSASAELTKPVFEAVSREFDNCCNFYSIEISDPSDVKFSDYPIYFFPTFLFIKNREIIESLSGTVSKDELEKKVGKFLVPNN